MQTRCDKGYLILYEQRLKERELNGFKPLDFTKPVAYFLRNHSVEISCRNQNAPFKFLYKLQKQSDIRKHCSN